MIYGVINHQGSLCLNNLVPLKKLLDFHHSTFFEKHFSCLAVGGLKRINKEPINVFSVDQSTNWSIFIFGEIFDVEGFFCKNQNILDNSIPHLLLNLFYKNGTQFVEKLNGDFIIILSNPQKKTTYVFRDHLGIIPFSYTLFNDILYFSSDTLALCRAFYPQEPIDSEYLLKDFKFTDNTLTPSKNVKRLLPGHYLLIRENDLKQHKYWFPEKITTDYSYTAEKVYKEATALLEDSVKIRVDKELRAASHISGGLDSSSIAALSRKQHPNQKNFFGYSWSPDFNIFPSQSKNDERVLVLNICAQNQIEPVFSSFSPENYKNYYENPLSYSSFPDEQLFQKLAQKNGVQIVFSGYGGDEFISCGTYGVFIDLLKQGKWGKYWKVAKNWNPNTILKSIIFDFLFPVMGILPLSFYFQNQETTRFIKKPYKKNYKHSLRYFFLHKSRKDMHLGMLYNYHIPLRTEEWYNWGSRSGVQYRYPLLDKRIIEFMLKIPSDYLYKESFGRILLREAAKGLLPEELRWSTSKIDPALFKYIDDLAKNYFLNNASQIEDFKSNPALAFFDFEKFEIAVIKEKQKNYANLPKSIFSTFLTLKKIHEFTQHYAE